MAEKIARALEEVDVCLSLLRAALVSAGVANDAWREATGHEYGGEVDEWDIVNLIKKIETQAAKHAINEVARRRFPGLPYRAEEWAREFAETELPLPDLPEWFTEQVGPTAREVTWEHMLAEARCTLYRVGEWRENRREAKLQGSRLSVQLYVWSNAYSSIWHNDTYRHAERLDGLEAVVVHALDAECYRPLSWRALVSTVGSQTEPDTTYTGWVLCPKIRTFKNGRLDLHLRDAELATKVKAILEQSHQGEDSLEGKDA